jgi:hypothetical protein
MHMQFAIDLPVRNEWSNVDLLRTSILNCFTTVFNDLDGCRALAMVVGELLENAVKYGAWNGEDRSFRLEVLGHDHVARISVENPVTADDPAVEQLMTTLDWLRGFPTPEEAYRQKLLEVASVSRGFDSGGLGLVRISYEGNCRLGAALDSGKLRVTAEMPY